MGSLELLRCNVKNSVGYFRGLAGDLQAGRLRYETPAVPSGHKLGLCLRLHVRDILRYVDAPLSQDAVLSADGRTCASSRNRRGASLDPLAAVGVEYAPAGACGFHFKFA